MSNDMFCFHGVRVLDLEPGSMPMVSEGSAAAQFYFRCGHVEEWTAAQALARGKATTVPSRKGAISCRKCAEATSVLTAETNDLRGEVAALRRDLDRAHDTRTSIYQTSIYQQQAAVDLEILARDQRLSPVATQHARMVQERIDIARNTKATADLARLSNDQAIRANIHELRAAIADIRRTIARIDEAR